MKRERATYRQIKFAVLGAYFDFCRDRGIGLGWPHEQVLGSVAYEYENVFESSLENLMLRVVLLVCSGGWYKNADENARNWIAGLLRENEIADLLKAVPFEESEEFVHDLRALKLILENDQSVPFPDRGMR